MLQIYNTRAAATKQKRSHTQPNRHPEHSSHAAACSCLPSRATDATKSGLVQPLPPWLPRRRCRRTASRGARCASATFGYGSTAVSRRVNVRRRATLAQDVRHDEARRTRVRHHVLAARSAEAQDELSRSRIPRGGGVHQSRNGHCVLHTVSNHILHFNRRIWDKTNPI